MSRRAPFHALACLAASVALAGCSLLSGPGPDPTQFYVINAVAPVTSAATDVAIGLGPVTLPSYLDRPEMARRVDQNQIAYDSFHRWAEPLSQTFERALAANLVALLGPRQIVLFPWYRTAELDYVVTVAASRFETQPDGTALLAVRWTLRPREHSDSEARIATYTHPVAAPPETAAALSQLAAELSQEIAAAIDASRVGR